MRFWPFLQVEPSFGWGVLLIYKRKSWLLTSYTVESNTDAKGRGSDLFNATQNDPIRTRAALGAALTSAANIRRIFSVTPHP